MSYCAEDVALETQDIPNRFKRYMKEYELKSANRQPGELQKVSQTKSGHGPSKNPYACYDLRGIPPKCTTLGAGRHKPKGWEKGDGGNVSYMFTPTEVSRHKNLSDTVIPFFEKHVIAANVHLQLEKQQYLTKLEAFLYKYLGNGFTMKFGECIYESIHRTMMLAGVPFDITSSRVSSDDNSVEHDMVKSQTWCHAIEANMSDIHQGIVNRFGAAP